MKRETAWRLFAGEYNDSTVEIKSDEEMAPSYILTPLGAKVNRVFVIGVLTDVENVSEGGDFVRAHLSDPTGVFTIYSGSYQPDVTDSLSNIDVPAFVAVVGKVRTYIPEEGTLYVSVRPERIMQVDSQIRDKWILDTCKQTKERIEAILEAMQMTDTNEFELKKLGYSTDLSAGIVQAIKNYGNIDLNKYVTLIQESLQYLVPDKKSEKEPKIDQSKKKKIKTQEKNTETKKTESKEDKKLDEEEKDFEEIEKKVLSIIRDMEGDEGAPWDDITKECSKNKLDKDTVEEALSSLMDKGLIYEPILGTIKTT